MGSTWGENDKATFFFTKRHWRVSNRVFGGYNHMTKTYDPRKQEYDVPYIGLEKNNKTINVWIHNRPSAVSWADTNTTLFS